MVREDVVNAYYKGDWEPKATYLLSGYGIGWHYDVGMQAVRMMMAGVFDRLPKLKIILGHWGELVSFFMYRLDEILDEALNFLITKIRPESYGKPARSYVDLINIGRIWNISRKTKKLILGNRAD